MDALQKALTRLKFRHLRVVEAVAEARSLSGAARLLRVSQPAVTKTVLEAEDILGATLFERGPTGVSPTSFGHILLARGRVIQSEIRHATEEIAAQHAGAIGTLVVGALLVSLPRLLPQAIASMRARSGECTIRVISGTQDGLMSGLRTGEIDLIVGRLPPHKGQDRLIQEILYQEPVVIVARRGHVLFAAATPDLARLAQAPWVFPTADSLVFRLITDLFSHHGLSLPRCHVESVSFELVRTLLLEQDMVAALPRSVVAADLDAGNLHEMPIAIPNGLLPVGITHRADRAQSGLARTMMQCLREPLTR